MSTKTDIFYNIINSMEVISLAKESVDEQLSQYGHILVTVGRLGTEKGQISIPKTAKMLAESGISFTWYVIGDGIMRKKIEDEIRCYAMEKNVILLGEKKNPFPYIKNCSIYVQTSETEGWCLTTQEARILHKPCVVTNIPVMHEQFTDGVNGVIAKGTDAAALYEGIMRLISSPELTEKIIDNLKTEPQDGTVEIQKLYDFLES